MRASIFNESSRNTLQYVGHVLNLLVIFNVLDFVVEFFKALVLGTSDNALNIFIIITPLELPENETTAPMVLNSRTSGEAYFPPLLLLPLGHWGKLKVRADFPLNILTVGLHGFIYLLV